MGDLRNSKGKSLWIDAKRAAIEYAFLQSDHTLARSPSINTINQNWSRDTVRLFLAKQAYNQCGYGQKSFIYAVLGVCASVEEDGTLCLVFERPVELDESLLKEFFSSRNLKAELVLYSGLSLKAWMRRIALALRVGSCLLSIITLKKMLTKSSKSIPCSTGVGPNVLTIKEGPLGEDKKKRYEPYWWPWAHRTSGARLVILTSGLVNLEDEKILCKHPGAEVTIKALGSMRSLPDNCRIPLLQTFQTLWKLLLFGSQHESATAASLIPLFLLSTKVMSFCIDEDIDRFICAENYMRESDAVNLVSSRLNIDTFSLQYSNMEDIPPTMLSTADTALIWSNLFVKRYQKYGKFNKRFVTVGYPYDQSFSEMRRAGFENRKEFMSERDKFVVALFDESVQQDRYGFTSKADYVDELLTATDIVTHDPDLMLLLKPQFYGKGVEILESELDESIMKRITSSVYQLEYGTRLGRNLVLPAEAAMKADFIVGQAIGGTAVVEAALVGKRAILVNAGEIEGENVALYQAHGLVFPTLRDAFGAISKYRMKEEGYRDLGDWTDLIGVFDEFRDGHAADRIYKIVAGKDNGKAKQTS